MPLPIPENDAMFRWDSTKLNTYDECPRKVFYEYLLGWKPAQQDNHLYFGDCYHQAMAHLLENGFEDRVVEEAQNLFEQKYRLEFTSESDEIYYPKDVFNAQRAIATYPVEYPRDLEDNELLYTEISGSAPIDADRRLHFRMDAIMRNREKDFFFVQEHKTKGGDFNFVWDTEWELAFQIGTYTHALYCLYPIDRVKGTQVNGIAFIKAQKTAGRVAFRRVSVWKTLGQMEVWLWQANDRMDRVYHDLDRLEKCTEDDTVLYAFPMNDRNCTKYFRICPFHEFCLAWKNPLQHCKQPPLGFKEEWWDPTTKPAKHTMELEWQK